MTERDEVPELPSNPELLGSQLLLKDIADNIMSFKPAGSHLSFNDVVIPVDGAELRSRLKDITAGNLLLEDGDSLLWSPEGPNVTGIGIFPVDNSEMTGITVRAQADEHDKVRLFETPDGDHDLIEFPWQKDWLRSLEVRFHYRNGDGETATEAISVETSSLLAGQPPALSRKVSTSLHAAQGYEGYNRKNMESNTENDAMELISLISELVDSAKNNT